jgi:hypothetical protein
VLPRLVREFYGNLEVVLDENSGIILQSTVQGHVFQVDPQVISSIVGVLVLPISTNPFNEVWSLLPWNSSGSSFMLIHRARSEHMLTSKSVPFLRRIDCSRRLFNTIYGPLFVGVSLFSRGLSSYMLLL